MAYRAKSKVRQIVFTDDHEFAGLHMTVRGVSIGKFLRLLSMAEIKSKVPTEEELQRLRDFYGYFADALVDWDMEDEDGNPVPPTAEGVSSLDFELVTKLVMEYADAIAGVSAPLGESSTSGGTFQEQSLPMEVRSESRAS